MPGMSSELKIKWLEELRDFIVLANKNTWAAKGQRIEPQRPGFKELEFSDGDWLLRDSFVGSFRAPGMTTIYYKGNPAWTMQYGGHGIIEGYESIARDIFDFLEDTLMRITPELPFRGPREYVKGNKTYNFNILSGDIEDGMWKEQITESGKLVFEQYGINSLVIARTKDRQPVFPWATNS